MRTALAIVLLICGAAALGDGWRHYGGDPGGTRFVADSIVTAANVGELRPAWRFRTGDAGGLRATHRWRFKATPVLAGGRLFFSSGTNRVFALDAATGEPLWVFDPGVDFSIDYAEMYTSRGVSLWRDEAAAADAPCASRVLLGTLDARLIALDAADGERCRGFGDGGEIDLARGIVNFRPGEYGLTSPVAVAGDVIVVGSSIGDNGAVELEPGVVRGFDAKTGEPLWSWDPVPRDAGAPGASSWGADGGGTGAANVWSVMSTDLERNLVFLPTTSPSPDFYGGRRPGRNRYANSVVALRLDSGRPVWDFQVVRHDLWDYDLAAQPLLTAIDSEDGTREVVVQATKMGHVFVLDRETGEPVFPVTERRVPQSDVRGEASVTTQPVPTAPPPLHPETVRPWDHSPSHREFCAALLDGVRYDGMFTPPSLEGTLLFPGNGGGTNWGGMAVHAGDDVAVLAQNRMPTVVTLIPRAEFDRRRRGEDPVDVQYTAQHGTPFGMSRYHLYNPENGLPCLEGPWSELIALDLRRGTVRWRRPLGTLPALEDHPRASSWGTQSAGGPIVTSTGLVFIAPRFTRELLAYRLADGEIAWRGELPAMATATPMSYVRDGAQYVVIAAGGDVSGEPADYLVAFRLDADAGIPEPSPIRE